MSVGEGKDICGRGNRSVGGGDISVGLETDVSGIGDRYQWE